MFLGCAPDTFMGAGIQTARKAIDDGLVGSIIGGNAFMMCHGHESWHPNPDFYYKSGGGPMFDMGPYYLTALVNLLGSIKEIERMSSRAMNTRTIASQARYGEKIDVEVQTHVCGLLKFDCGAICTITTSFDVWKHSMPKIELYGTKGSIKVPDPNNFGGDVLCSGEINDFGIFSSVYGYAENSRGLGLSDMADCILGNRKVPRANSETALHVLEAMCALIDENGAGKYVMRTKANIQEPMPEM